MAIRTLGELKDKSALPALQALTISKEMFVADYANAANAAIAAINNTPYTRPTATAEARASDIALLPADIGTVMQLSAQGGQTVPVQKMIEEGFKAMSRKGDPDPDVEQKKNRAIAEINTNLLKVAEQMGNLRIDAATLGLSRDVTPQTAFGVVIMRGQYDPTALSPMTFGMSTTTIDGTTIYRAPYGGPALIPTADRLVMVIQANPEGPITQAMVTALKTNKGTFATNTEMAKLIKTIDITKPLWGVAQISESYRQAPPLVPFDTITLSADTKDGALQINVAASGSDEAKTKSTVDWANAQIQTGIDTIKKMATFTNADVTPVVELLQSIKIEAKGTNATASLSVKGGTESLVSMFIGTTMTRRMPRTMQNSPMQPNLQPR